MDSIVLKLNRNRIVSGERSFSLLHHAETDGLGFTADVESYIAKSESAYLDLSGFGSYVDIYLGGGSVKTCFGLNRSIVDVSSDLASKICIKPAEGFIPRPIKLFYSHSKTFIPPYGIYAKTKEIDSDGVELVVSVELFNNDVKKKVDVEIAVVDKARRLGRKKKHVVLDNGKKIIEIPIRLRSGVHYLPTDTKMFTLNVSVTTRDGEVLDKASSGFGMVDRSVLDITDKFIGSVVSHANGILGKTSYPDAEMRKLLALKNLGYNCIRYIGLPSDAALDVLDSIGMNAIVDIFDNWEYPKNNTISHIAFKYEFESIVENTVKSLRNHPSVIMYSIGNHPEESYGRGNAEYLDKIISIIKKYDSYRPITASLSELVPTVEETEQAGIKLTRLREFSGRDTGMIALGREKNLFTKLTKNFISKLDVVGYEYMPPEENSQKLILATASSTEDEVDWQWAMNRHENVIGVLGDCGISNNDYVAKIGDIDATFSPTVSGVYRSILAGTKTSMITSSSDDFILPLGGEPKWSYENGQTVTVNILTAGDVVALYLNGNLVGRKLAGRINKYIATFTMTYEEGKLEAISFYHGREICRAELKTTGAPKSIKLLPNVKRITSDGLAFVEARVYDVSGDEVLTSMTDIHFEVTDGEVVALGNRDGATDGDTVTTVDGRALLIVRGNGSEKISIKATSNGLTSGRTAIKVKA